jgi:hypothetical protein
MFINIILLYVGVHFYLLSLPTAMFLISINPTHYSVHNWGFTVHAVFTRSNPVLDKNLRYFSVVPFYYTFCCRRTSKIKITEMNPNADAWSSLKNFLHVQEITFNYRITATMEACNWNQSWASSATRGWTAGI